MSQYDVLRDRFESRMKNPAYAVWNFHNGSYVCVIDRYKYTYDPRSGVLYFSDGMGRPDVISRGVRDSAMAKEHAARHYRDITPDSFHHRERFGKLLHSIRSIVISSMQ